MAKFTLTIPDKVAADLERWAMEEGRTKTGLGGFIVEAAVRHKYESEYPPPDAYVYGLKGSKTIETSPQKEGDELAPDVTSAIARLIDGKDLTPEEETAIANLSDRSPDQVHSVVRKLRERG